MLKYCDDRYKTQKICDKTVSKDPFTVKYCHGRYKTQEIYAIDHFLPALKFVSNWFVRSKMIKKVHSFFFANNDIFFFDEDSGNVTFSSDEMGILCIDLNNVNVDDVNFDEDDPGTIIHVR